jgi:hypothetical protein
MPRKQRSRATVGHPLALNGEPREAFVERLLARDETVDGGERVQVGELGRRFGEALPAEPLPMALGPGRHLS